MPRFITRQTDAQGRRWCGPEYERPSQASAEKAAEAFPGMTVLGELVGTVPGGKKERST
jgi:hypothetical protein